eukprot:CAMPEP_0181178586 /NCGR_PEP_ID=MMETSP1096-20121128/5798_1 /TAXON_ID=156174 ORGANISM="Chrysochromulina ericina, Strain CCMP281" /NCGR_SAMPLE_ID=MMETSP1096 /ASSEMBLY_ACC=CAM_ASM_000453 /LENGTH=65 /DNA_ID=CAMNT_0023266863 /DNA_START=641 /DNA_END=838 /DNA_ORIENTATION=+
MMEPVRPPEGLGVHRAVGEVVADRVNNEHAQCGHQEEAGPHELHVRWQWVVNGVKDRRVGVGVEG